MKITDISLTILIMVIFISGCSKNEEEIPDQASLYYNEQAFPGQAGELKSFTVNSDTLYYEKFNDLCVFQGDIILTNEQLTGLNSKKGIGLESLINRWPGDTIYYRIQAKFPYKSRITDAIKFWERYTPLRFVESDYFYSVVNFKWDTAGCYSNLGMSKGQQYIYGNSQVIGIADWADVGTVIHEIGHTIGLVHENSRSDRDQYISVNLQNVKQGKEYVFKKVNSQFVTSQFDFNSIMLCSSFFMSGNGLPTITKTDGSTFNVQRKGLSREDINLVKAMYSAPRISEITASNITDKSALVQVSFQEFSSDKISETGLYWGTSLDPEKDGNRMTLGSVADNFTSVLNGLLPNTRYYVKAYAKNAQGTFYGNTKSLKTMTGILKDIDGNEYWTVNIGTQQWMAENLKTTRLNNGTAIPNVSSNTEWAAIKTPGYCWYNSEPSKYGALYNYYAVNTGRLCPTGWHVPSDNEWKFLELYLGMSQTQVDKISQDRGSNEGGKLKAAGTNFWIYSKGVTNETGFSALPGGYRVPNTAPLGQQFYSINSAGNWWSSSSEGESSGAYLRVLTSYPNTIGRISYTYRCGLSVRCVKD